ncbi:MAG TPA: hydrogenase iron-sulfur subunit, partial [Thermodesulfatator sp.]|nr:hydrogenase iron-sulfur subunit [Thermodesulfatator sp.]
HYQSGNYEALIMAEVSRRLLEIAGVSPERFTLEWASAAEAPRFVQLVTGFTQKIKDLGPLGDKEGVAEEALALRLEAARRAMESTRLRSLYGNLAREIKKEGNYDPKHLAAKVESKLLKTLRSETLTEGAKLLLAKGPKDLSELASTLGAEEEELSELLAALVKRKVLVQEDGRYALARKEGA